MKKQDRKTENIQCDFCGIHFEKAISEIKRNSKLNRRNFCSRSCSSKSNLGNFNLIRNKNYNHLNPANKKDEYSIFRTHFKRIQKRNKDYNLTLQDMLDVWNNQNGICIYSKVLLQPCKNIGYNNPIYTMSIDRIDSSKGYVKDNIQFISIAMNHLKNSMTHEQMLEILSILKNN